MLSALAFRAKAYWGYSAQFMDACRTELSYSAQQINDQTSVFYVAQIGEVLVGFYQLAYFSPHNLSLEALFVEPTYIGQGYGRALLDHAKAQALAAGAHRILIQSDPHAAPFYRAMGGRLTGYSASASVSGRDLPMLVMKLENTPAH